MKTPLARREFLKRTGLAAGAAAAMRSAPWIQASAAEPGRTLVVGVMGLGRGMAHVDALLSLNGVEVGYVCDVDERRRQQGLQRVAKRQTRPAKAVDDFRRVLDDPTVDALTIAAPNFWHAPATILACSAGKHVYVEKPGSHNAREGELMVAAARKYQRHVQMGNQRRSWPGIMEMIDKVQSGVIGRVVTARCCYASTRGSIGHGRQVPVPAWLDYVLWQGPAPSRPYVDNLVHYNWHWRWHWGGGELANNGVHALDLARWGLGVDYPRRVTYAGGRYCFDDDQETPDTGVAMYDFGKVAAMWDGSSCHARRSEKPAFVAFYGEGGTVTDRGNGYAVYDEQGKEVATGSGPGGDAVHFDNFIQAIRGEAKLNAEIGDGQKSTLLCHLGNLAYRTTGSVTVDPGSGRVDDNEAASRLWGREYAPGWEPKV